MARDRMSAPVRLVVSDIDGTLVRQDKTLSDGNVAAVARLQAAGVAMSLISARPASGVLWIAERLGLTGQVGAFNGGTIVQPDGTVVEKHQLDRATAEQALTLVRRPGVILWIFSEDVWHISAADAVHTPREVKSANQQPTPMGDDVGRLLDSADKIVAVWDDHDALARLEAEVAGALGARATVGRSQAYYLDITAPQANKGDGVAALARAAGVDLAQVAVLGDQRNDLPMFARAGLSVAMAQGPEEVRAAADFVSTSNDEDGVAVAIDRYLLPRAG